MSYAGTNFAGENRPQQVVAAWLVQNERSPGHEIAATRKQDDVLEKAQRAGLAPVLIVDFAIDMIGVCQVDQPGARIEIAVVPPREAHPRRRGPRLRNGLAQVE